MKNVLSLSVMCLGLAVGSQQASAQHPGYGQHGRVQQGYVQNGFSHHLDFHHGHHYAPTPTQHYSGYAAPVPSYVPSGGVYGGGYCNGQVPVPQTTNNYSNNYYGQPAHVHHSWHPGHYLLGHH